MLKGINDDGVVLSMYNNHQEVEKQKRQQEKDKQDAAKKAWEDELKQRLGSQSALIAQHRRPDAENRVGGMAGKFIHLAELQPESLAAMTLMQYIVFAIQMLVGKKYSENLAVYNKAKELGFAYDGTQTIYRTDAAGQPNYEHPYKEGEEVSVRDIMANGFHPKPDILTSGLQECMAFLEQQAGPDAVPKEWQEQLYGVIKAQQLQNQAKGHSSTTQEDRMAAGIVPRPSAKP